MIKFQNQGEAQFWTQIYTHSVGGNSSYSEGDPAAEAADKAVRSLRMRMDNNGDGGQETTPNNDGFIPPNRQGWTPSCSG